MSINDIATVTRIPVRSLERLESGLFEELPADVFVRGFLRSYARCVGLDAEDIIRRYTQCGMPPAPVCAPEVGELAEELTGNLHRQRGSEPRAMPAALATAVIPAVHATAAAPTIVEDEEVHRVLSSRSSSRHEAEDEQLANETRAEQTAPQASKPASAPSPNLGSEPAVEPVAASEQLTEPTSEQSKRKRKRRRRKQRRDVIETTVAQPALHEQGQAQAEVEPAAGQAAVESAESTARAADVAQDAHSAARSSAGRAATAAVMGGAGTAAPAGRAGTAAERAAHLSAVPVVSDGVPQPITGRVHTRSQSTRLQTSSGRVRASTVTTRPVLIIDDEHPEDAERSQEDRVERNDASWRSFLPPALLDSDDGSHRGTLTLAVIILVIVATLTMSYLLRRPNVSGDGVTWQHPVPAVPAVLGQVVNETAKTSSPRA